MEDHRSSQVFPPTKTVLSNHYTFKGICRAASMEKSGVAEQNEPFCVGLEAFRPHFKAITHSPGPSACLQFIGPKARNFLTGQYRPANHSNIYSPRKVVDTFISKGGDVSMG